MMYFKILNLIFVIIFSSKLVSMQDNRTYSFDDLECSSNYFESDEWMQFQQETGSFLFDSPLEKKDKHGCLDVSDQQSFFYDADSESYLDEVIQHSIGEQFDLIEKSDYSNTKETSELALNVESMQPIATVNYSFEEQKIQKHKYYFCVDCKINFSLNHKKAHELWHDSSSCFRCNHCQLAFRYKRKLTSHNQSNSCQQKKNQPLDKRPSEEQKIQTITRYFCTHCQISFLLKQKRAHELWHDLSSEYRCNDCKLGFENSFNFISHSKSNSCRRKKNKSLQNNAPEEQEACAVTGYFCTHCQTSFLSKQQRAHELWHDTSSWYKCNDCKVGFSDKKKLTTHRASYACLEKRSKNVECGPLSIKKKKRKSFVCECGYIVTKNNLFAQHKKSSHDEAYVCFYENCHRIASLVHAHYDENGFKISNSQGAHRQHIQEHVKRKDAPVRKKSNHPFIEYDFCKIDNSEIK